MKYSSNPKLDLILSEVVSKITANRDKYCENELSPDEFKLMMHAHEQKACVPNCQFCVIDQDANNLLLEMLGQVSDSVGRNVH